MVAEQSWEDRWGTFTAAAPADPEALDRATDPASNGFPGARFARVDLRDLPVDAALASLLPEPLARHHHVAPIGLDDDVATVAVAAPEDLLALDDVRLTLGSETRFVVAPREQVDAYLDALFPRPPEEVDDPARESEATGTPSGVWTMLPGEAGRVADSELDSTVASTGVDKSSLGPNYAELVDWLTTGVPVQVADDDWHIKTSEDAAQTELEEILQSVEELVEAEEREPEGFGITEDLGQTAAPEEPEAEASLARPSLEEYLLSSGAISVDDLDAALVEQRATGRALRDVLTDLGFVSEADVSRAIASVAGLAFVDLNDWTIDLGAADLVPEALARRYQLLGIGFDEDGQLVVAIAEPSNVFAIDDIRTHVGRRVSVAVSPASQIDAYFTRVYRHDEEADLAAQNAAKSSTAAGWVQGMQVENLHAVVEDAPIVTFVNLILRQALNERASDVHLEPAADSLNVRFRVDGVLHAVHRAPKAIHGGVTSRLKVMANLDIGEHRVPQDGRITLSTGDREIDLRVATLPTVHGEKVVLRVLDKSTAPLDLERIGFSRDVLTRYEHSYRKPSGTILVTGPTGSGKSTTLYATLNKLNSVERNLITVEDPVEYQLPGVNQVQVNTKAGLSFAGVLRSILRSDPDVVLVGEIRDKETATIAVEAALTGHLVLSCLHTNNAASTPLRLIEMGVEPFLVGSALDCVLAQRLTRVLCEICATEHEPSDEELHEAGWQTAGLSIDGDPVFRRAVGCQACSHTGYRGRIAIQEVMPISDEIEQGILARAQSHEIEQIAIAQGMRPMRIDGLRKVALGLTSLEEIQRVIS